MFVVSRTFPFEAGHRLLHHNGACKNLHGHSYRVTVMIAGRLLDTGGMVLDFADVKNSIGRWIDDNFDHTMILNPDDPLLDLPDYQLYFPLKNAFIMPADAAEPTAENIARTIAREAKYMLERMYGTKVWVHEVTVQETEKCRATVTTREEKL